jgi:sugar lactone lactonase YvrE
MRIIVILIAALSFFHPWVKSAELPTAHPQVEVVADSIRQVDGLVLSPDGQLYATSETLFGSVFRIDEDDSERISTGIRSADGITLDPSGNILVSSEARRGAVYQLDIMSRDKRILIEGLTNPEGIMWGPDGALYIVEDNRSGKVLRQTSDGREEMLTGLDRPENITMDEEGNFYVTETGRNRVLMFRPGKEPRVLNEFQEIVEPDGITYSSFYQGVFVTEDSKDGTVWFIRDSEAISVIEHLRKPQGIVCDADGNLYVSEQDKNRILKINVDELEQIVRRPR